MCIVYYLILNNLFNKIIVISGEFLTDVGNFNDNNASYAANRSQIAKNFLKLFLAIFDGIFTQQRQVPR